MIFDLKSFNLFRPEKKVLECFETNKNDDLMLFSYWLHKTQSRIIGWNTNKILLIVDNGKGECGTVDTTEERIDTIP